MNKKKTACETKPDRRGKCEPGFMVDPKSGPKKSSKKPDCTPDDEMQCKPGEKAQTRQPGDNDAKKKQACGKPDPNDEKKRKCNRKKEYEHYDVTTDSNGNNGVGFERFKKSKKEAWERDKEKRKQRKDENKKKLDDKKKAREAEKARQAAERAKQEADRKAQEKAQNDKNKKKERMGKCFPVTALFEVLKYDGTNKIPKGQNNPYEWLENRGQKFIIKRSESDDISMHTPRHRHQKRFYQLFLMLVSFAARLWRVVADAMKVVGNVLPRLRGNGKMFQPSNVAKNGPLAGGRTVTFANMRNAAQTLVRNRQFRECVLNGLPLPVTP